MWMATFYWHQRDHWFHSLSTPSVTPVDLSTLKKGWLGFSVSTSSITWHSCHFMLTHVTAQSRPFQCRPSWEVSDHSSLEKWVWPQLCSAGLKCLLLPLNKNPFKMCTLNIRSIIGLRSQENRWGKNNAIIWHHYPECIAQQRKPTCRIVTIKILNVDI